MSAPPALEPAHFDARYRDDPDPWSYESSPYELDKYARTLATIPRPSVDRALELGCSNGAFTVRLAPRCRQLLAVDFSGEAVRLARQRTASAGNVRVDQHDIRNCLPDGSFDLIICSEILYYVERADVKRLCEALPAALRTGGSLIAVHWRGNDPEAPLDGDAVHGLLKQRLAGVLDHVEDERGDGFNLDRWERPES